MAGSGHVTQKRWNVSAEGPETDPEVLRSVHSRINLRSERFRNRRIDEPMDNACDSTQIHIWKYLYANPYNNVEIVFSLQVNGS